MKSSNGKGWLFRARLAPLCLVPRSLTRPAAWPRHDQVDQVTTSIALPLTRVSPFKSITYGIDRRLAQPSQPMAGDSKELLLAGLEFGSSHLAFDLFPFPFQDRAPRDH